MAICPFLGDQPFWARRMSGLGVAPQPLERKQLTADTVTAAIKMMSESSMCARAEALGQRVRQEDGVGAAVRFIEARCALR
jgi:UDP:flavonoid glycosyltransferase YjiC (YdhE family)